MVVDSSAYALGAMRTPSSAFQDDLVNQEFAFPKYAPANLPFTHYALIYIDNNGMLNITGSPSISECDTLFTPDICEKFLATFKLNIGSTTPALPGPQGVEFSRHDYSHFVTSSALVKKPEASVRDPASGCYSKLLLAQIDLEIGNDREVLAYYTSAFEHFQQINCREIAKAFIKHIEPKKQVRYPYNGGKQRDPEQTKPGWWPTDVTHKEPDHLLKGERIRLLIHIICKTHTCPDTLKAIAHDRKKSLKPPAKIGILDEIIEVRKRQVQCRKGEIDRKTMICVVYGNRNQKGEGSSSPITKLEKHSDIQRMKKRKWSDPTFSSLAQQTQTSTTPVSLTAREPSHGNYQLELPKFKVQSMHGAMYYSTTPGHLSLSTPYRNSQTRPFCTPDTNEGIGNGQKIGLGHSGEVSSQYYNRDFGSA